MRQQPTNEQWAEARRLRAAGTSWLRTEELTGITFHTLRSALDPGYTERAMLRARIRRKERPRPPIGKIHHGVLPQDFRRVKPEEAARAIASVPKDTRSFTARVFGDPLPGRSAYDRRGAVQ